MAEFVLIKDIRQGMKNINVVFIVLDISHPTITKENREVRTFKVADNSACINVSIWDEAGQLLLPGDIVKLTKGYAGVWRNCLTIYCGKNGDLQKINDFCMVFNEQLNMSEPNPALGQGLNAIGGAPPNSVVPGNNGNSNNNGGNAYPFFSNSNPPIAQPTPLNIVQSNPIGPGNGGKASTKGIPRGKSSHRNGPKSERR